MVDDSINMIRAWLAQPRSQKNDLAREAGLNKNTLTDVESSDWNPRAKTLKALEGAIARLTKQRAA